MKAAAVIIGHNQWREYTLPLIESIRRHEPHMQIVVVDSGSEPPYPARDDIRLMRSDNSSNSLAVNTGVAAAQDCEWFLILDNDTLITAPFLDSLRRTVSAENVYGAMMHYWAVDYLAGWCILIHKDTWRAVGPYDERYVGFMYEEVDWCYRATLAGYPLREIDLPVSHLGHRSHHYRPVDEMRKTNQARFLEKFGMSDEPPLVDVILPTYNRPGMLARAITSVQAQTLTDYRLIVVNDGGVDVGGYPNLFPNVRLIQLQRNGGLPRARNIGIRASDGKYIAYLDDDDIWLPDHLETLVYALEKSHERAAYTDTYYWYDETVLRVELSCDYSASAMRKHNLTPIISVMHERSLLAECGNFDEALRSHEDYDLWLRMINYTGFIHIARPTALYSRRSDDTQMSSDRAMMAADWIAVRNRYV